jgi:hypothetical protein
MSAACAAIRAAMIPPPGVLQVGQPQVLGRRHEAQEVRPVGGGDPLHQALRVHAFTSGDLLHRLGQGSLPIVNDPVAPSGFGFSGRGGGNRAAGWSAGHPPADGRR